MKSHFRQGHCSLFSTFHHIPATRTFMYLPNLDKCVGSEVREYIERDLRYFSHLVRDSKRSIGTYDKSETLDLQKKIDRNRINSATLRLREKQLKTAPLTAFYCAQPAAEPAGTWGLETVEIFFFWATQVLQTNRTGAFCIIQTRK